MRSVVMKETCAFYAHFHELFKFVFDRILPSPFCAKTLMKPPAAPPPQCVSLPLSHILASLINCRLHFVDRFKSWKEAWTDCRRN